MLAVVVKLLQGSLSINVGVAQQGLWAIRNLAVKDDNKELLGAAGACEGEQDLLISCLLTKTFHL